MLLALSVNEEGATIAASVADGSLVASRRATGLVVGIGFVIGIGLVIVTT